MAALDGRFKSVFSVWAVGVRFTGGLGLRIVSVLEGGDVGDHARVEESAVGVEQDGFLGGWQD